MYRPSLALRVYHRPASMKAALGWLVEQLKRQPELTLVYCQSQCASRLAPHYPWALPTQGRQPRAAHAASPTLLRTHCFAHDFVLPPWARQL